MDPVRKTQIEAQIEAQYETKIKIRALLFNETPKAILTKYSDYSNVFSVEYIMELSKYTSINNHTIKLEKDKLPHFRPIYSLDLVELKMLKTYIKTNLANNFIQSSKFLTGIPIFFN